MPDAPHRLLGRGLVQEVGKQEEDEHDEECGQDGETPSEHREQQRPRLVSVPEIAFSDLWLPFPEHTWTS